MVVSSGDVVSYDDLPPNKFLHVLNFVFMHTVGFSLSVDNFFNELHQ